MSADAISELFALPLRAAAPMLRVETVSTYESLLALEPVWNRLFAEAGIDHPFLRHEWIRTWWECFGEDKQLHVLVVTAGGDPIAIAPLMLCFEPLYGLKVRQLKLITNVHTPRMDFIVGRCEESVYRAIWDYLASQKGLWDVLVLPQVPAESITLQQLPALAAAEGFRFGLWRAPDSPCLQLTGTWETYFNGLARKHRSNLRNRLKRLERLGPVELEVIDGGPELGSALEEGFQIEAAAWKGREGTAIGCRPELRRFYTRQAAQAAEKGWLRLYFLTVGGQRIAFGYSLCFDGTIFLLKPGYIPAYAPYSPSNLLFSMVLREAFSTGILAYDFLGCDEPWKMDWTAEKRSQFWLFVFQRGSGPRLLYFVKFHVVPWLRNVYQAYRAVAARVRRQILPH
jgi:hypothetical protein